MSDKPYWFFSRPHRKLIRVPKSLAAFSGVVAGQPWRGNRRGQIDFETQLERLDLKRQGSHRERDLGRGGSGGRTHAQLLYSLGLFFFHKETENADEEIHLTLAGKALVDQEDALPILRKQVMAFQFPSPYSVGIDVSRRFKLRPFVLLLKLLRSPILDGYLTDQEIAACVIGEAVSHSDREADRVARLIVDYRTRGVEVLPDDFVDRMDPSRGRSSRSAEELIDSSLRDIANTAVQWIRYTGYAVPAPGRDFDSDVRTVTALNQTLAGEVDAVLAEWSSKPLITMREVPDDSFAQMRASEAFQRSYGVKAGMMRDNRTIREMRGRSEWDRTVGLVSAALSHIFAVRIVTSATDSVVAAIVNHTGLDSQTVREALDVLISSPAAGVSSFLDRYEAMAFSGNDEAINFEKATEEVLRETFQLSARHVGQGGTYPDVEVWSEEWSGIIDTKAYAAYDLPQDHQLRMISNYIPRYSGGIEGHPLEFFMYISGGFSRSFNAKLQVVSQRSGKPGCGIAIQPWRQLIVGFPGSGRQTSDLLGLWRCGREITAQDVAEFLATP